MERAVNPLGSRIAIVTAFLVAVAVWPFWINYATAPRWAVISIGIPLAVAVTQPRLSAGSVLMGLSLVWALISGIWTPSRPDWLQEVWTLSLLTGAFLLGQHVTQIHARGLYLALAIGLAASVLVCFAQYLGHPLVRPLDARAAGLFFNPNLMGELLFPTLVLTGLSSPVLGVLLLIGAVIVQLRSGVVAFGVGLLVWLTAQRRYWIAAAALLAAGAGFYWLTTVKTTGSFAERLTVWQGTAEHLSFWGAGAGSFFANNLSFGMQVSERMASPHNEPLLYVYELGIGALPLLAVFAYALIGKMTYERMAFVVLFVEGLFGFPFHVPATILLGGFLMGRLCQRRSDLY